MRYFVFFGRVAAERLEVFLRYLLELVKMYKPSLVSSLEKPEVVSKIVKESQLKVNNHENSNMLIYEDLKKILLIKEVINNDFCELCISDTLAKALSIILLKNFNYVVLTNDDGKFVCVVENIEVFRELPPFLSNIPLEYRAKDPNPPKEVSDFTLNLLNRKIEEVFNLENLPQYFYESDDRLSRALEELAQPYTLNLNQKVVPILRGNRTVAGTVSVKEILLYIINKYRNELFMKMPIRQAFPEKFSNGKLYSLLPNDTFSYAYLSLEYTPKQFILVCDSQSNLIGIVDRCKVAELNHPLYQYLADMPVSEMMENFSLSSCVSPEQSLEDIISLLLTSGVEASILVEDKTRKKLRPLDVITPTDIAEFFLINLH